MKEIEGISSFQFFILVFMFVIGSSVLYIPTVLTANAKEDAWLVAIIGGILGIFLAILYLKLAEEFQGANLIQMYELVFGNVIGKIFTLIFSFFSLIMASLILRGIGDFMVTQIMPDTPVEIIMIFFVVVIIMALYYGIEVASRTAEIFFPWVVFLFLLGLVLIVPEIQFSWILPIMDNGVKPIIKGTFSYLGFPFLECVLLLMLMPYLKDFQKGKKSWLIGTTIGAVVLFIPVILSVMVLGADLTAKQMHSTYILAKKMGIPKVFERMEIIIAIFWIITIFYKLLLCFYCFTKSIASLVKIQSEKILAYPLGMILVCTAIIAGEDIITLNDFSSNIWPFFALQTGFFIPVIILFIVKIKKMKSGKHSLK